MTEISYRRPHSFQRTSAIVTGTSVEMGFLYSQLFVTPAYPTHSFKDQTIIVTGSNVASASKQHGTSSGSMPQP